VLSLPAAISSRNPITISWSSSRSPSSSACTSTLVRSSVGAARRSAISLPQRANTSGTSRSITLCAPSGVASGSPAPTIAFIRFAHASSSSGERPMKLPITRATTGWATSLTRSQVSRAGGPSKRSSTSIVIARIASSCSAIRFGVKPRWNSAFSRSCLGGSIPMNIARCISNDKPALDAVKPPTSEE